MKDRGEEQVLGNSKNYQQRVLAVALGIRFSKRVQVNYKMPHWIGLSIDKGTRSLYLRYIKEKEGCSHFRVRGG